MFDTPSGKTFSNKFEKTKIVFRSLKKLACAFVLCATLIMLAGCSQQAPAHSESDTLTPSDYMVKLTEAAGSLSENLNDFSDAVAANDVSAMQSKLDNAYTAMDAMEKLEVPDSLKDVSDKYKEAVDTLKTALSDYLALYLEIDGATQAEPFNFNTYSPKLEAIQKQYDEGLNALEEADKMATEL